ncbi:MAG TPA: FHA domain-containing serine/threonine-protein kinase [Solirubrobacteraceae bacterium]|nr:FHA domain-containing serine/threonine-protein kinase [Solirubrobacteraceae bacterium]
MDGGVEPGSEFAGYRIRSVLGQGGMGIVYLAERPQGTLCALKVLSGQAGADPSFATRFKREAEYAESLDHPAILELYDVGEAPDGTLFFAMQYVSGADLRALLTRDPAMGLKEALSILRPIGDALDCAHAKGLIHRDVKPGNIIVADDRGPASGVYLTDFGLSKNPTEDSVQLTQQGQFIGTIAYTAPEEILAQPRDHLIDIYSLGCVLYEMLVGVPPFVGDRDLDVMYAHIGNPRPNATDRRPDLPPGIDAIIAKAIAISPADRYQSCAEFIAAASALLPEPSPATPEGAVDPVPSRPPSPGTPAVPAREPEPPLGEPPASLRFVVQAGLGLGRELIVEDELALGRLTTLDGALADDSGISRRHGRVWRDPDGHYFAEDLYSTNGTFVNGVRINHPHPLQPGDELRIGRTVFAVSDPQSTEPSAPDPALAAERQPDEVAPIPELVVSAAGSPQATRLVLRLELDLKTGELAVGVEGGATARIVRDGDGWRVETP